MGVSLQEEASLKHCLSFLLALYKLIFNKPVLKYFLLQEAISFHCLYEQQPVRKGGPVIGVVHATAAPGFVPRTVTACPLVHSKHDQLVAAFS